MRPLNHVPKMATRQIIAVWATEPHVTALLPFENIGSGFHVLSNVDFIWTFLVLDVVRKVGLLRLIAPISE
jgi:hypothetical protein